MKYLPESDLPTRAKVFHSFLGEFKKNAIGIYWPLVECKIEKQLKGPFRPPCNRAVACWNMCQMGCEVFTSSIQGPDFLDFLYHLFSQFFVNWDKMMDVYFLCLSLQKLLREWEQKKYRKSGPRIQKCRPADQLRLYSWLQWMAVICTAKITY